MKTKPFHHILIIALAFLSVCLQSCESPEDYEMIYITRANKDWMIDSAKYKTFTLADSLGNLAIYKLDKSLHTGSSYTSSGSLFNKKTYQYENIDLYYYNQRGRLSMKIEANNPPQGDRLYIDSNYNYMSYDFGSKSVTYYSLREKRSEFLKSFDGDIKPEFHDSVIINGNTYYDAMSIVLSKTSAILHDSTIIELTLAKHAGIVSYKLNCGVTFERVTE